MNDPNRPNFENNPEGDPFDPENGSKNESNQVPDQSKRAQIAPEKVANNMNNNDPTNSPGWERSTLEKLAFASLNEQKATRRWKTFVRLSCLLGIA